MPLWLSYVEAFSPIIGYGLVAYSVIYASRNFKEVRRKAAFQAYDKFADRMHQIRVLQASNPNITTIWEGGKEGFALKNTTAEHFYFVKILLQANEAIFHSLNDPDTATDLIGIELSGWEKNLETDLSAPKFRNIWKSYPHLQESYSPQFQNKVEEIIKRVEAAEVYSAESVS